jgi:hypothetical protein
MTELHKEPEFTDGFFLEILPWINAIVKVGNAFRVLYKMKKTANMLQYATTSKLMQKKMLYTKSERAREFMLQTGHD